MKRFFARIVYAPLAVCVLFLLPQREVTVTVVEWEDDVYHGFPLLWQKDSVNSGDFSAYLGPLAINLALCALAAFCLVQLWRRLPISNMKFIGLLLGSAVWTLGAFASFILAFTFVALGHGHEFWYDPAIWDRVASDRIWWF